MNINTYERGHGRSVDPIDALNHNLESLFNADAPEAYTTEELLQILQLDGEESDGLSLAERLFPNNTTDSLLEARRKDEERYRNFIEFDNRARYVFQLLDNGAEFDERQEEIIRRYCIILDRQISREGPICSTATEYAQVLTAYRPAYFSDSVGEYLRSDLVAILEMGMEEVFAMFFRQLAVTTVTLPSGKTIELPRDLTMLEKSLISTEELLEKGEKLVNSTSFYDQIIRYCGISSTLFVIASYKEMVNSSSIVGISSFAFVIFYLISAYANKFAEEDEVILSTLQSSRKELREIAHVIREAIKKEQEELG